MEKPMIQKLIMAKISINEIIMVKPTMIKLTIV
jgi:hypothetical protein